MPILKMAAAKSIKLKLEFFLKEKDTKIVSPLIEKLIFL